MSVMTTTHTSDHGDVEILRDPHGIPHVLATTAAGAMYGQGQPCGEDRRWQIEFMRLRAEGLTIVNDRVDMRRHGWHSTELNG